MDDTPDMYAHYFISAQIYVEHNAFFLPLKRLFISYDADRGRGTCFYPDHNGFVGQEAMTAASELLKAE